MRKYTAKEIEDLRRVLETKFRFGVYVLPKGHDPARKDLLLSPSFHTDSPHREEDKVRKVEEQLRTHMFAGHVAQDLINSEIDPPPPTDYEWLPISTAPTDDSEFLVGKYEGEKLWNNDYSAFVWDGEPVWQQALSHHDNPHGPHPDRGWNHRNGPLGGSKVTHWARVPSPPAIAEGILVPVENTTEDEDGEAQ